MSTRKRKTTCRRRSSHPGRRDYGQETKSHEFQRIRSLHHGMVVMVCRVRLLVVVMVSIVTPDGRRCVFSLDGCDGLDDVLMPKRKDTNIPILIPLSCKNKHQSLRGSPCIYEPITYDLSSTLVGQPILRDLERRIRPTYIANNAWRDFLSGARGIAMRNGSQNSKFPDEVLLLRPLLV